MKLIGDVTLRDDVDEIRFQYKGESIILIEHPKYDLVNISGYDDSGDLDLTESNQLRIIGVDEI